MDNLTVEEWIQKFPYLKDIQKSTLLITKQTDDEYKEDDKIDIGDKEISIKLLIKLIEDDKYYEYIEKLFKNEINSFSMKCILFGDTIGGINLNKIQIVKGLEMLMQIDNISFSNRAIDRYNKLYNTTAFDKFIQENKTSTYNIKADHYNYSILVSDIISFMNLPEDEFEKILKSSDIETIYNIPKIHFIYASYRFFRDSGVFSEYVIPDIIEKRYMDIASCKKVDIEAINKINETKESNLDKIKINEELKKEILAGITEDLTDLEKAIYIYIKMCKILTYDEEYYAVNQQGGATLKHKNIDYVYTITPTNNKVVCFEFNLIYGKLLDELGIKFESYYKNCMEDDYGYGHANLKFRVGKFLVSADSVTSILHGDMMQAKLNQPLRGLKCINTNNETQIEFYNLVTKIYELLVIQKNNKNNSLVEHVENFEEILSQYLETVPELPKIDLDEKLDILIKKVNSTKLIGIDSLSYVLQLRKILFTEEERNNNFTITILRNNETNSEKQIAQASAIFVINKNNVNDLGNNLYYLYNPNQPLLEVSREYIQQKFDKGMYNYIDKKDPKILGIEDFGGKKK